MASLWKGHGCVQVTRYLAGCCNSVRSLLVPRLLLLGWRLSRDMFQLSFSYPVGTSLVAEIPVDPKSLVAQSLQLPLKLPGSEPQDLESETKGKWGEGRLLGTASFAESRRVGHFKSQATLAQESQRKRGLAWAWWSRHHLSDTVFKSLVSAK